MTETTVDIKQLLKNFDATKRQVPFALSQAINQVAFDAMRGVRGNLPQWLNLTKTFIPRQVIVQKSNKRNLTAIVGFSTALPLIDKMLASSNGGVRLPFDGGSIAIPVGVKRSAKGGITKSNRPRALLAKPNVFRATINGRDGIWRRETKSGQRKTGRAISLLYVLKARTKYKPGGPVRLVDTVNKIVERRFTGYITKNLARAIETARK